MVRLLHARLAIQDLHQRSNQPFLVEPIVLAFNGEIYNFLELRVELEGLGHRFTTTGDTEVLARALAVWGEDAFRRFDGMWAVAAWDSKARRIILARDRFGEKPLYYALHGGTVHFASSLVALSHLAGGLDDGALDEYLAFGFNYGADTLLAGVTRVLPGEVLVFAEQGSAVAKVSSMQVDRADFAGQPCAEGDLWSVLDAAVEARTRADVPYGLLLSGGIDSALVAEAIARVAPSAFRGAFTVTFPGSALDEQAAAATVAKHFGLDHEVVECERTNWSVTSSILAGLDDPIGDSSLLPTAAAFAAVADRGLKVCLSGDGADELFGGYGHHAEMATTIRRWPVPQVVASRLPDVRGARLLRTRSAPTTADRFAALRSIFLPSERRRSGLSARAEADLAGLWPDGLEPLRASMHVDERVYLAGDVLTKVDRASMRVAVESRTPWLAPSVVAVARSIPPAGLVARGRTKVLLRDRLATTLPEVAALPKQGFSIPFEAWWSTEALEHAMVAADRCLPVARRSLARWAREEPPRRQQTRLFTLIALGAWLESVDRWKISAARTC